MSLSKETMAHHWAQKPYASKILDHFYSGYQRQSSTIADRETLLNGIDVLKAHYPETSQVPVPDNIEGVAIKVDYMEVWLNSPKDRLHDRTLYKKAGNVWQVSKLVP